MIDFMGMAQATRGPEQQAQFDAARVTGRELLRQSILEAAKWAGKIPPEEQARMCENHHMLLTVLRTDSPGQPPQSCPWCGGDPLVVTDDGQTIRLWTPGEI